MTTTSPYVYLVLLLSAAISVCSAATKFGVIAPTSTISPATFVAEVVSRKIEAVRILDSSEDMIKAFAQTNVTLLLTVPNDLVSLFSSNLTIVRGWVEKKVVAFHRRTKISQISVGIDVMSSNFPDVPPLSLLPAMENLHLALSEMGINYIGVSASFAFFHSIPAELGEVKGEEIRVIVKPILRFRGWPCTAGVNDSEVDQAALLYSRSYVKGLIDHLRGGGRDTAMSKNTVSEVYVSDGVWDILDQPPTAEDIALIIEAVSYSAILVVLFAVDFIAIACCIIYVWNQRRMRNFRRDHPPPRRPVSKPYPVLKRPRFRV
ncbi:unnamed protein product [Microthlaspi erraticum]|uniref:glucan endo-1,3-beta-D-glucosidase n=1 Tax=Microthlaspi erraticum TaxID=1685480 RepID=A0A6D2K9F2_9BRAS|nr:unnamed protein product [Microthlaspi erraticum]